MEDMFAAMAKGVRWTDDLEADAMEFLAHHGCSQTADHSLDVAHQAQQLAIRFGAQPSLAFTAGLLHDCSAVIPHDRRVEVARQLGLAVLPQEATAPMILHQRLSAELAKGIFGVSDSMILSAIGCHTTLKAGASVLDKVLFVADKISWDQPGVPPYRQELLEALGHSLDRAAWSYLQYLWLRRQALPVVHPWFVEAYEELTRCLGAPTG